MDQNPDTPAEESIFHEEEFSMEGYDKHIRNARIILFIMAGLVLLGIFTITPIDNFAKTFAVVVLVLLAGVYVGLALWTRKRPYSAILTALILYICLEVLGAIAQPASVMQGWFIKIVIFVLLVAGLRNARDTQRMMDTFGKKK